jgi:hypothetical protein
MKYFRFFAEGIAIFREQVPVVNLQNKEAVTYRTYRINKDLQIWLVENRDYRSPNLSKDTDARKIDNHANIGSCLITTFPLSCKPLY